MSIVSLEQQLKDRLAPFKLLIEQSLENYLRSTPGCPQRLSEAMRYSVMAPGKRLRPILVLLAAEAAGATSIAAEAALPAACAIEFVHCYSLIHDDLPAMDNDELRRGLPTCHRKFDEATAILAGDALLTLAFEVLSNDMPPSVALSCCQVLAQAAGRSQLVGGQGDDLAGEGRYGPIVDSQRTVEHLQSIHARKTAAIIRAALKLGGLAIQASPNHIERLDQYGKAIGLAFQIVDDCLDVESTAEQMGKSTRKDDARGKITYPGLLGLEQSRAWANQLYKEAVQAVEPLGKQAGSLIDIARYVVDRSN